MIASFDACAGDGWGDCGEEGLPDVGFDPETPDGSEPDTEGDVGSGPLPFEVPDDPLEESEGLEERPEGKVFALDKEEPEEPTLVAVCEAPLGLKVENKSIMK